MSSNENAIEIHGVSKCFQVYDNPAKRLKQFIVPRVDRALGKVPRTYHNDFWALQDISFVLPKGQTMGIVGRNGSGKSTLLQIIAGTLSPTQGNVSVNGRVAALLELGAGFNPDFTGRENVYLNASLLGLTREETDNKLDDILAFADIGHFIDSAVRSYSSGMLVRLAFAVQAQIDPEILIVDEALAVGDAKFQAKCFARLNRLKQDGASILFVSHATEQIVTHCDSAILLDSGKMQAAGKPKDIVNRYLDILFGKSNSENSVRAKIDKQISTASIGEKKRLARETDNGAASDKISDLQRKLQLLDGDFAERFNYNPSEYRWGNRAAEIVDFYLQQDNEPYPSSFEPISEITLLLRIKFNQVIIRPIIGFAIKTKEGITIYNTNTEWLEENSFDSASENDEIAVSIKVPNLLYEGDYFLSVGVASSTINGEVIPHDRRYDAIHISVGPVSKFTGFTDLNARIDIYHE